MTAQTIDRNTLHDFGARAGTIITDAEECDLSSVDAVPTLEDADGNALQPFGIYVGTSGDLICDFYGGGGVAVTLKGLAVGFHPIALSRIDKDSGADDILFLYGHKKSAPGALL